MAPEEIDNRPMGPKALVLAVHPQAYSAPIPAGEEFVILGKFAVFALPLRNGLCEAAARNVAIQKRL